MLADVQKQQIDECTCALWLCTGPLEEEMVLAGCVPGGGRAVGVPGGG